MKVNMAIIDPFEKKTTIIDPSEKKTSNIVDPFERGQKAQQSKLANYGVGTIISAINFLDQPVRAAAATVTGTIGAVAKKDPEAYTQFFHQVMEKTALPESEWGKTVSNILNMPFELLDKGAEKAGDKLNNALASRGYSPEMSATLATALHTGVDALPMLLGKSALSKVTKDKPKTPPILTEKPTITEKAIETPKGPIPFEKVEIPKVPQDFKTYREDNGLDVADFLAERRSENLAKDISDREKDAAWEWHQKQTDPMISRDSAWGLYEDQKAKGYFAQDHEFVPQGGQERIGMGKAGASQRGGPGFEFKPAEIREKIKSIFTTPEWIKEKRAGLDTELSTNSEMRIQNEMAANQAMKTLRQQGLTAEMGQKFAHYYEGSIKDLSPEEHYFYNETFVPTMDLYREAIQDAYKAGGKELEFHEGIFPRYALEKGGFLDRLLEGSRAGQGGLGGYARSPSAMKERSVMALEMPDGTRKVITMGKKNVLTAWENGKPEVIAKFDGPLKVGMEFEGEGFNGAKLTHSTLKEASDHTDIKYFQDGVEGLLRKVQEIKAYTRELETLKKVTEHPDFEQLAIHEDKADIPDGYRYLKNVNVPQLRKFKFEPNIAETLEDYLKPRPEGLLPKAFELANNYIIKALFMVPIPHMNNELLHWVPERGWSWVTPEGYGRLVKYTTKAVDSVMKQDAFQKEIALNGGRPLYTRVANEMYWKGRVKESMKAFEKDPSFAGYAKTIGMAPAKLANFISDKSSQSMWAVRDMMYTEAIMEKMDQGMTIKDAILEVEKHMPSYKIPNRVLGSRSLARIMKNPLATVFSYYHYGVAKSFAEFGKAAIIDPIKGSGSKEAAMKSAVNVMGQMAVLGILYSLLYPQMDKWLSKVSGKSMKMRRAGGLALIEGIQKMFEGEKVLQDIVRGLVTPAPMVQVPIEILFNRELFTGQQIYKPGAKDNIKRIGKYAEKQLSPIRTGMQAVEGKKTVGDTLTEYLGDVKVVDRQKEMDKRMKKLLQEAGL